MKSTQDSIIDNLLKTIPRVGVAVLVLDQGKVLLGKRKSKLGNGLWSCAGGHLEFQETVEACAKRELFEETGLEIQEFEKGFWSEHMIDGKHYITCYVIVKKTEGSVLLKKPDKCESWQWFTIDSLPTPLFPTVKTFFTDFYKECALP